MDRPLSDPTSLHGAILLGRYRVEALIGQGGMALVYAGRHLMLDREVAIKVLRQRYARRQTVVDRFLQEARAASRVRHEHIAEVTDFGATADGVVFMVMDRLVGETVAETIEREGRMPWPRARGIALQLCDALQVAHDNGVVHRDVSLKNCFLLARGRHPDFVKLLDFGIARVMGSETSPDGSLRRLTTDTQIMGTPEFMSPEQATRTGTVDSRSDVYAMGVVLYAMLTARLPFEAATPVDVLARHLHDPVPPPSEHEPSLAAAVEAIVLRALEKDPARRFQSMTELADALRAIPDDARRDTTESSAMILPVVARAPTRRHSFRRVVLAGAALGLAGWGWHAGGRVALANVYEMLPTFAVGASDAMESPSPAAHVVPEPAPPPASEPRLAVPKIPAEPPESAMMRTATIPPAPPPGWRDPPRAGAKHKRWWGPPASAAMDATPPVEPAPTDATPPVEPPPTAEPSPPVEVEPASEVVVPAPTPVLEPIEEVKNPFAE